VFCANLCTGPLTGRGSCLSGQVCEGLIIADGGALSFGFCNPTCIGARSDFCDVGTTCNSLGYCR
jgi:hypothetical protein